MMLALTASFALAVKGEKGIIYTVVAETIKSLIGCLTCYVVWVQASSTQFNFYDLTIVQEHDGSTRLICNRRTSPLEATLELSESSFDDSCINSEVEVEQVEDPDLY
jgi:hypothetical protein